MLLSTKQVGGTAVGVALAGVVLAAVTARLFRRVEVQGDSMRPTLLPGDRLLILRLGRPQVGELAVVADPRRPTRLMVKRVASVGAAGVTVVGDNPAASTDSRRFGPLPGVHGRPVYRYHPAERAGRLRVVDHS